MIHSNRNRDSLLNICYEYSEGNMQGLTITYPFHTYVE